MKTGWIKKLGPIKVERREMGRDFGAVDLSSPPKGCCHTTEGNSEVPNYGDSAPQFTIGKEGVYQHRKLGRMAGTLRHDSGPPTNGVLRIQFEMVGFSSVKPWAPTERQQEFLHHLFEFAHDECDIPKDHVWPDDLADTPLGPGQLWATTNNPRRKKKFPSEPGWYFHAEIPGGNSHWDMGSCLITPILKRSSMPKLVTAYALVVREKGKDGVFRSDEISPFFSKRDALWDWMVRPVRGEPDQIRFRVRRALVEGQLHVAERKLRPDDIKA
jgi:hypothetical protein